MQHKEEIIMDDELIHTDPEKYIKECMHLIQKCRMAAFEISTKIGDCSNSLHMNAVGKSVSKLNSVTSNIFKFYNVQRPNTAITMQDKLKLLSDCNESFLDILAADMAEATGKKPSSLDIDELTDHLSLNVQNSGSPTSKQRSVLPWAHVEKPQQTFAVPIDNSKTPFIPILKDKPHSKKPLSILLCIDDCGREYYNHPYSYELIHYTTPQHQLENSMPIMPLEFESTPYMFINTEDDLKTAIQELSSCDAIAVDLEHNSYRSYLGLTCLLQISSRTKDYIVDTLQLRGNLDSISEVFANPKIIKVFHGASNDILWLQRDLGVYVVNMFDTHQATILLKYPTKSLSYLLTKFCSVDACKLYQKADWRLRPLPDDYIHYARQDTHYLLYIFDKLRNELIEVNINYLHTAYSRSTNICLERYEKPYVDENSHMELYSKSRVMFNSRQRFAFKNFYMWRDDTARKNDESVEYTLRSHMMQQICQHLPSEVFGILNLCNPVPYAVNEYKLVLHQIIVNAKKLPIEQVENVLLYEEPKQQVHSYELKMDFTSKFDFSQTESNPTGLSTILNDSLQSNPSYKFPQIHNDGIVQKKKEGIVKKKKDGIVKKKKDGIVKKKKELFCNGLSKSARKASINCPFDTPFARYCAMQSIQKLLDEKRNQAKSVNNEERVQGVLDFLGKLRQPDQNSSMEEVVESEANSIQDSTPEDVTQTETPKISKGKKRPLQQTITENKWKLLHDTEDLPENFEVIGMQKRQKSEKKTPTGPLAFKPFDYSTADTSFLKTTKTNHKEKIKERFKAKRSQNSTGLKKSGLKSFSWGAS